MREEEEMGSSQSSGDIPSSRKSATRDRPAAEPGGCDCLQCGCVFVGAAHHTLCGVCVELTASEIATAQGVRNWRVEKVE